MGVERAQDLFPTLGYVEDLLAPDLRWNPAGSAHPNRTRLWALNNGGDGDCVFHSVAWALWGRDDPDDVSGDCVD
ncbi:unnamed protein product [Ascophyllum nodosum]